MRLSGWLTEGALHCGDVQYSEHFRLWAPLAERRLRGSSKIQPNKATITDRCCWLYNTSTCSHFEYQLDFLLMSSNPISFKEAGLIRSFPLLTIEYVCTISR